MLVLVLFGTGGAVLATALALALSRLPAPAANGGAGQALLDRIGTAFVLTFAVWIATSWALAIPHALDAASLAIAGALELGGGVFLLFRLGALRPASCEVTLGRVTASAALIALVPVALWTAFAAWRGTILPPYNHDALAYHYPRAVLIMQAHGYDLFDLPEPRATTWPADFELLAADFFVLLRSDHGTAILGTAAYVGVALFAALVALEWWGGGAHVAAVATLTAGAPVAILHSGLEKNDLLSAFFILAAFYWAARWYARGGIATALLATVALALAVGTKLNGGFVFATVVPIVALGAWRHRWTLTPRQVVYFALALPFLALLLGGWPYVVNIVALHRVVLPADVGGGYGRWFNLVECPFILFMAPFGQRNWLWDPFRHARWWLPLNDIWFSSFGAVFSVLLVLLVPCALRYRPEGQRTARAVASAMALLAFALALPTYGVPDGFLTCARYFVFLLPFLAAWTVSPITLEIERHLPRLRPFIEIGLAVMAAWIFCVQARRYGYYDAYAPPPYVAAQLEHPDNRVPWVRQNRAATVFDRIAPADATCAIDVGFDTWIYPAYGEGFTRRVDFLPRTKGPVPIADDIDWVIVDRSWNVFFGNPGFTDMTKAYLLGRGAPSEDDMKVSLQLTADPAWELVYRDPTQNQAIFHRRGRPGWNPPQG
jgi:hypothetical protein